MGGDFRPFRKDPPRLFCHLCTSPFSPHPRQQAPPRPLSLRNSGPMEKKKRISLRRSLSMRVGAGKKEPVESSTQQADTSGRRPQQSVRGDPTGREAAITIDAVAAGSGSRCERGWTPCLSGFRARGPLPFLCSSLRRTREQAGRVLALSDRGLLPLVTKVDLQKFNQGLSFTFCKMFHIR